jgi:hypothetical protein
MMSELASTGKSPTPIATAVSPGRTIIEENATAPTSSSAGTIIRIKPLR